MIIESTQNQTIKALAKLRAKKERDSAGVFLVEGEHMLQEAADAGVLEKIFQLPSLPQTQLAPTVFCTQPVLNRLSAQNSDAKYIGLCHRPRQDSRTSPYRLLLLDHIQDPGNLGTLIRSAYSFGIEQVVCSPDCADPFGPKALQSSQGALFHIDLKTAALETLIPSLRQRQIPVIGTALHHDSIELHQLPVPRQYALIIGNEGQGIRETILEQCDQTVHIKMSAFESLNAAIAGSIVLYAFQFPSK